MVGQTTKVKTPKSSYKVVSTIVTAEGSTLVIEDGEGLKTIAITPRGKKISASKSELYTAMVRAAPALKVAECLPEPEGVCNTSKYPVKVKA